MACIYGTLSGSHFAIILGKVATSETCAHLRTLKSLMRAQVQTHEDLCAQLAFVKGKTLGNKELRFLEEVLLSFEGNVWTVENMEHVARIFGHDQAVCPALARKMMDSWHRLCNPSILFEKLIPHCLGCIRIFDLHYLRGLLKTQRTSMRILIKACRAMGSTWDVEVNGSFASHLPKELCIDRYSQTI